MTGNVVLLADADGDFVEMARCQFEAHGYEVIVAADGLEALSGARLCRPDLMIVDGALPGFGGLDLCRMVQRQPGLQSIPIIIVTANERMEDRVLHLEAGADSCWAKSTDMRELLARAKALLRRSGTNASRRSS
jgi:DNA-binding response OmpR family regulator